MTAVSVTELQSNLDHYLGLVQKGEEVIVSDHGQPVARINQLPVDEHTDQERRLIAAGKLRPAKKPGTKEALDEIFAIGGHLPPDPEMPRKLLQALLADREESR